MCILCIRSLQIFYKKELYYRGIRALRFVTGKSFLEEIDPKYNSQCFCTDTLAKVPKKANGCLFKGALDLTACHGKNHCGQYKKFDYKFSYFVMGALKG